MSERQLCGHDWRYDNLYKTYTCIRCHFGPVADPGFPKRPIEPAEPTEAEIEGGARAICHEWGYLWDADPEDDRATGTGEIYDERPTKEVYLRAARAALLAARKGE